jgi:hypothetical protein
MSAYDDVLFRLQHIPRIPVYAMETLAGAISREDSEYFVGQVPCRKAPGPDGLP